jgi:predicted MFS family arabinose efflux permease
MHVKISSASLHEFIPLLCLASGTFATGTESFMIAALLPGLAADLSVSITAAGQLMTVFALTYALSSPILAAATGGVGRRKLLLLSMTAFAAANFVAAAAVDYWQLMAARILLAGAAGLYVPSASALAGAVVSPQRRGTALAIVSGGTSIAVALGVPLGAVIGHAMGWRMTFVCVGIVASLAVAGLLIGLRRGVGEQVGAPSLRQRFAVVQQTPVLVALLVTTIWATGAYTVYSYLALYLTGVAGIDNSHVGLVLFIWGCAAVTGLFAGGAISDRFGTRAIMILAFRAAGAGIRQPFVRSKRCGRQNLARMRAGRDRYVGRRRLGIFSGSAGPPDRHRGSQSRADRAFAQCVVHVSGILARRRARIPHVDPRFGREPGLGRCSV